MSHEPVSVSHTFHTAVTNSGASAASSARSLTAWGGDLSGCVRGWEFPGNQAHSPEFDRWRRTGPCGCRSRREAPRTSSSSWSRRSPPQTTSNSQRRQRPVEPKGLSKGLQIEALPRELSKQRPKESKEKETTCAHTRSVRWRAATSRAVCMFPAVERTNRTACCPPEET